jgi:hypothetical protein
MKNSLTRLMLAQRGGRGRIRFQSNKSNSSLSDELRAMLKKELLALIQNPDEIILSKNSYDQLSLLATLFVKYDFPA